MPSGVTLEVRPRRRRVYIALALKGKVDGQAVSDWCFAMTIISTYRLLALVGVCRCAPCYVTISVAKELEYGVNKAIECKAALPKALRDV